MNIAYVFSNIMGNKNGAEDTQMKYQSFKIQGSKVTTKSPEIECKEDEDGEIYCELPDQVISYKVEDLSTN